MASLDLGDRRVGPGEPCYVIAEAGVNHDGDVDVAHRLVDVAAACGADAVKFQTFDPAALASEAAAAAAYQAKGGATSQRELLASLVLPDGAWADLAAHAAEAGLHFLSTPFDLRSAELLVEVGMPALKVPSGELDNVGFIRAVASLGLPLLLSTGMATEEEVAVAAEAADAAPSIGLLHCVSAYPADPASANLHAMAAMAARFGVPVGWSDHTVGHVTAVGAVALGASLLEKHVTLDRDRPGPDHAASADPPAFRAYVDAVRTVEAALGDGVKRPVPEELDNRRLVRRSHHLARSVPAGSVLAADDVVLLRPATGIPPTASVVGRVTARDLAAGEALTDDALR